MHRALVAGVAAIVALVFVAAVFASDPTKEQIARTRAGNAEAAALVLKKRDLPSWVGGRAKPDLSSSLHCSNYAPKQSDLVLIGAADSRWAKGTTSLDSQTAVLRTPRMVQLDWKRTVADPHVLPCLREAFVRQAKPAGEKLISLRWIPIPRFGAFSKEYRLKMALSQTPAVRITIDALVFGAGRDELSLVASGLSSHEPAFHTLQLQLARRLANRLHG
jgi:hypothetical protein